MANNSSSKDANSVSVLLIISAVVAFLAIGLGAAYTTGALDPYIEKIGEYLFKAEAKAEEKKLQAQGLKEGEDFLKGDLKGNQHINDLKGGVGSIAGLKKGL